MLKSIQNFGEVEDNILNIICYIGCTITVFCIGHKPNFVNTHVCMLAYSLYHSCIELNF